MSLAQNDWSLVGRKPSLGAKVHGSCVVFPCVEGLFPGPPRQQSLRQVAWRFPQPSHVLHSSDYPRITDSREQRQEQSLCAQSILGSIRILIQGQSDPQLWGACSGQGSAIGSKESSGPEQTAAGRALAEMVGMAGGTAVESMHSRVECRLLAAFLP